MNKNIFFPLFLPVFFVFFFKSFFLIATGTETDKPLIYGINIKKEINSTTWLYLQNGLKEANELHADGILIHMNTYGGAVIFADSIRTAILNSQIPVYAFIDNNAASAGALIAIACDSIYMHKGASIGAASVVDGTGEKMADKFQSYMRSTIRATAEAKGKKSIIQGKDTIEQWRRDPKIAEAFVDEFIAIPGIVDSTHILSFTAEEARKHGYCEGIVENIDELITQKLNYPTYTYQEYKPTTYDEVKGFLTNPALQVILIMLIIGGIYFELQSPGIGFPTVVAVAATILYFTPLYMDGLAEHWEIAVFIVGILLIFLEIFVFPGIGIAGIGGFVLVVCGLSLALINNVEFDFSGVPGKVVAIAISQVLLGLVLSTVAIAYLSSKIGSKGIFRKMALETSQNVEDGYVAFPEESLHLIGKEGITKTVLRPSGKVIIDGEIYDAVSDLGFIEKNEKVKVVKYETGQVYVEPLNS